MNSILKYFKINISLLIMVFMILVFGNTVSYGNNIEKINDPSIVFKNYIEDFFLEEIK